jgi:hypothetical protein
MRTLAGRVDEHRARAVDDIPRGNLAASRLQHVFELAVTSARDLADDREYRPDGYVDVDVRRTVEWIEEEAVLPALELLRNLNDPGLFLGRHCAEASAVVHRLDDDLVGENVELLLRLALDVLVFRCAEDVGEARAAHLVRDHFRRERQVVENARELTRGFRMIALLFDDEPLDGDD